MHTTSHEVPPKLKGLPVIGQFFSFTRDPLGLLETGWRQLGDCFSFSIGPRTFYAVSRPEWVQRMFVEDKNIFQREPLEASPLTYFVGESVLTTDGAPWLVKRRTLQPVFHRQRLAGFADAMVAAGVRMLERWAKHPIDTPISLGEEMRLVTLDIINRTMFGVDILSEIDKVGTSIDLGLQYLGARLKNPFLPPPHWPLPANRPLQRARAALDEFLYRVIRERRAQPAAQNDLLGMLISARDEDTGETLSDELVRNEIMTMYAAGHETTATSLVWVGYVLNKYPAVRQALQQEVDSVLQGRLPTLADLPNLPYTLMVLEETLRLYPPFALTFRIATKPATIGPFAIPKGATVFSMIRHLHLHPKFWEQPTEFRPARFAPETRSQISKHAYMPFLIGPHLCIGQHFALMESHLLLALIAQRYTLEMIPGQNPKPTFAVTVRPDLDIQVHLRPR